MALHMEKPMCSEKKISNVAVLSLLLVSVTVRAMDIELELEAGIGRTDNITRATDTPLNPAVEDTVYTAGIAVTLEHASGRADVDLRGSLFWHDYKDGPYESETLPALDATAIFRITDQVFSWFVRANIGQQSVDPFQPVTPGNREDFTYLTTGPSFTIPMGTRTALRADAWYSDVGYEIQPQDNSRQGAQVGVARAINPSRSISLNVRTERTDFDNSELFAPIERYDAFLQFETEGSRNELSVEAGFSTAERAGRETEEPLFTLDWRRQVTPATSFVMALGTRISDAAESFRGTQGDSIDVGDVQNQQDVTDPFREDFAGLTLDYTAARTTASLGYRLSDEEYGETVADRNRQVQRSSARVSRSIGRSLDVAVFAELYGQDYESLDREDDDMRAGITLTWHQLRTLEFELRFERFERDSSEPSVEYTENRAYFGIRYVPEIGR